jgi:hypothetical protein
MIHALRSELQGILLHFLGSLAVALSIAIAFCLVIWTLNYLFEAAQTWANCPDPNRVDRDDLP